MKKTVSIMIHLCRIESGNCLTQVAKDNIKVSYKSFNGKLTHYTNLDILTTFHTCCSFHFYTI